MKKQLVAAAAVIAALGLAPAANATVVEGIQLPAGDFFDHFEGESSKAGTGQVDLFNFTVTGNWIAGVLLTSVSNGIDDLEFEAVDLDGVAFQLANGIFSMAGIESVPLADGAHTLRVQYKSSAGKVTYAGDIALDPVPVPAPASWAVMLAAIGGLGFTMRRRAIAVRAAFA